MSMLMVLIFDAGIGDIDGDIDVIDVYSGWKNGPIGHIFECLVIREWPCLRRIRRCGFCCSRCGQSFAALY